MFLTKHFWVIPILLAKSMGIFCQTAVAEPSVCVQVFNDERIDQDQSDYLSAKLSSKFKEISFIDRTQLGLLTKELGLQALNDKQNLTLGHLRGVDLFMHVRNQAAGCSLELILSQSGETLYSSKSDQGCFKPPETISTLGTEALHAISQFTLESKAISAPTAIFLTSNLPENADLQQFEKALDKLKVRITNENIILLNRDMRGVLVSEQLLKERSLVGESPLSGLRNSNFIIEFRSNGDDAALLRVIETRGGTRLLERRFQLAEVEEVGTTLIQALKAATLSMNQATVSNTQVATQEGTSRLLHSLERLMSGQVFEAFQQLEEAEKVSVHSQTIKAWRTFLEQKSFLSEKNLFFTPQPSDSLELQTLTFSPGTLFLGIDSPSSLRLKAAHSISAIGQNAPSSMGTLFQFEDANLLQRELDSLTGLASTKDLWRNSVGLAHTYTLWGKLNQADQSLKLQLVMLEELNPQKTASIEIELSADTKEAASQITSALTTLYSSARTTLSIKESSEKSDPSQLREILDHTLEAKGAFVKQRELIPLLLSKSPRDIKFIPLYGPVAHQQHMQNLLKSWAMLRLEEQDPLKSWLALDLVQENADYKLKEISTEALMLVTTQFPNSPAALVAQARLLQGAVPEQARASLPELIAQFEKTFPGDEAVTVKTFLREWLNSLKGRGQRPAGSIFVYFAPGAAKTDAQYVPAIMGDLSSLSPDLASKGFGNSSFCDLLTSTTPRSLGKCRDALLKGPRTSATMENYFALALRIKEAKQFELLHEVLNDIILWRDENGNSPDPEVAASALYLDILLTLADGDKPEGLRKAQKLLEMCKDKPYHFLTRIRAWDNPQLLEVLANLIISDLRQG